MRYWRQTLSGLGVAALCVACAPKPEQQAAAPPPGPARGTPEWKIENAMSGGPAEIGRAATIMDWPATPTGQPTQLRAGTNGYTCFPDMADTPMDDPSCMDGPWMTWAQAWMGHTTPNINAVGIAYMLQGGQAASLTDPFKMQPDSGQPWGTEGPHLMMVVPRSMMSTLSGIPDQPGTGGPWVMWKNTPYVHVMMPSRAGS